MSASGLSRNAGSTPLVCVAGTVATLTPPTLPRAPKRTSWTCFGSPPADFTLAARKVCMSLPAKIVDFLAAATIVVIEFGVTLTENSGFPQVPAFADGWWAGPRWSPCTWDSSTASILPRRGSFGPRTVSPASYRMRVPSGSSKTSARSRAQNSPSWLPSGVILTRGPCVSGPPMPAHPASAKAAMKTESFFMGSPRRERVILQQHDVELLLRIAGFDLDRHRLADEVLEHGERGRFVLEQEVDDGLRRDHAELARIEGARLAHDLAQDVVAHRSEERRV